MFKSLKGQLLLDGGKLRGSFFHRTVVLICQHDADGAFGLVLNRSSGNKVADALVADLAEYVKGQPLYLGGPVQPQALSFLHTDTFIPDANVMTNVNLGHSLDGLEEISESYSPTRQVKVFAGIAFESGWSMPENKSAKRFKRLSTLLQTMGTPPVLSSSAPSSGFLA